MNEELKRLINQHEKQILSIMLKEVGILKDFACEVHNDTSVMIKLNELEASIKDAIESKGLV